MDIICPHCHFEKSVDPDKLPDKPVKATCPKCHGTFTFDKSSRVDQAQTDESTDREPVGTAEAATPMVAHDHRLICNNCGCVQAPAEVCRRCHSPLNPSLIQTGVAQQEFDYAGFWIRFVAYGIDSFIIGGIQLVLTLALGLSIASLGGLTSEGDAAMGVVTSLFGIMLGIAYAVFFIGYCGQTPGKMALRIKVVMTDGRDLSYGRAALREVVGKFLSGILLGIGYLMVAFDSKKQGLHDRLANTFVIKL
ncbi:MAG: zinc-ribbon domain-containing protein [Deltaproteobacteria bacterium]|jgi:uncharacterized RDD family membrane protein YckC|nr:zinc-ribbon domain-containing protein [Deltaproteobacteria bacterium]MBW2477804.1 zinc-ribbon domain-containing protein [Deltaproteobacteria bacterium]MBW2504752.1 zinc-ribbon domain-containing protein [Deltaproteobacteria bacterium]